MKSGDVIMALKCPKCGAELILKNGIYGDFWSCSNYPKCTYTEDVEPSRGNSDRCPRCGSLLLIKNSMKHGLIYGCSNYPACKYFRRS